MLNISDEFKNIYKTDYLPAVPKNYYKNIIMYFPSLNLTIENDRIVNDSLSIDESLCSDTDLTLGACEAAQFKIVVADILQDLNGLEFTVTQIVDGIYTMPLGTYKVLSCERQSDRRFKEITAYDAMKNTDVDVSAWYNNLTFPITVKEMRESLLSYLGISYENQTLTNDTVILEKTISPSSLVGRNVLKRLCEINAGFGHITRLNTFKVIQLSGLGLYPSETLYPSEDLFPAESGEVITAGYQSIDYEDYLVEPITSLKIRQDDEDCGTTSGSGTNTYIITGNYLIYGKSSADMQTIADNIFLQIKNKYYRPHSTTMIGLPYLEVGDSVLVVTSNDAIESFVFKRTLTGIQSLKDEISATGNQYRSEATSLSTEIQQLKGKTLVIKKSIEELSSTLTDTEQQLQSQITQTASEIRQEVTDTANNLQSQIDVQAGQINLKVSKGDVSSQISIESDQVVFDSNRLVVNSTNFKLDEEGNAEFSGDVKGATITGSEIISTGTYSGTTVTTTIEDGRITTNGTMSFESLSSSSRFSGINSVSISFADGSETSYLNSGELSVNDVTCIRVNGGIPITTSNRNDYTYPPATHTHNTLYSSTGEGAQVTSNGNNFRPHSNYGDDAVSCGSPSYRFTQIYAATATISTSDENEKTEINELTEAEKRVAQKLKGLIVSFKFKDAVAKKGDKARKHIGVMAQKVAEAFVSEGLDPYEYGIFCSDTWYEKDGSSVDENDSPYKSTDEGVIEKTRLGLRYEELWGFILAAL